MESVRFIVRKGTVTELYGVCKVYCEEGTVTAWYVRFIVRKGTVTELYRECRFYC
jgi:hypothetical protein